MHIKETLVGGTVASLFVAIWEMIVEDALPRRRGPRRPNDREAHRDQGAGALAALIEEHLSDRYHAGLPG